MATIKEMTENMYYPTLAEKAAYLDGANAVLEKVECHLNRICVDNHSDDDLEDMYDTLCEMVKNLKGE